MKDHKLSAFNRQLTIIIILTFIVFSLVGSIVAEGTGLTATLEVVEPGVDIRHAKASTWQTVTGEMIVSVGDTIRTDETGQALITFFADGTDTDILPNTEFRIKKFQSHEEKFEIRTEVIIGQTFQRLNRILDMNSSYNVNTPAITLGARGTAFGVRVDQDGARTTLVVTEGVVQAENDLLTVMVPAGFGLRSEVTQDLSDVVPATNFEELDASLEGCPISIPSVDDMSMNVRTSPGMDAVRVGTIDPGAVDRALGKLETENWFRIHYRGGYGWVLSSAAELALNCPGLRIYSDDVPPEDITLYVGKSDLLDINAILTLNPTTVMIDTNINAEANDVESTVDLEGINVNADVEGTIAEANVNFGTEGIGVDVDLGSVSVDADIDLGVVSVDADIDLGDIEIDIGFP